MGFQGFRSLVFGAVALSLLCVTGAVASAQPQDRYDEEPTGGLHLPTTGISGEPDAFAVVRNPAGLYYLSGNHIALAANGSFDDNAIASGRGLGFFLASNIGGKILPRVGLGLGVEFLRPPEVVLPDPGDTARITASLAFGLGPAALGVSWHRFVDGAVGGLDSVDVGLSTRLGSYVGIGVGVRDLFSPDVAGITVQRRYEAEVAARPLGTSALETAIGARIGESRGDVDGWLRATVEATDGVFLRAELASNELRLVDVGGRERDRREWQASAGVELSFGGLGAAVYGTGSFVGSDDPAVRSGTLVVRATDAPMPSILGTDKHIEKLEISGVLNDQQLIGAVAYLRRIARDDSVVGLVIHLNSIGAGWASLNELRREFALFKKSGKKIVVYMLAGNTRSYYLASVADRIVVDPAGGLRLQGFAGTSLYFKGLFDRLGVEAQFARIEEYKSAPEAYTRERPTVPAMEARNQLYDSIYRQIVAAVAAGRKLKPEQVEKLIDNGPYTAGDLEKQPGLVDHIATKEQLPDLVAEVLGGRYPFGGTAPQRSERWTYPKVAVIVIEGDIVDGQNRGIPLVGRKMTGGDTISKAIAQARADSSVKAIILRINTPGGSALASEVMYREVFKTRGVKPILCSLGDVAASGGYFAAAGCDVIYANPMTVTGSIGIFNGKFDLSRLLARIGVTWQTYKRGARADLESYYRPMTDGELALMKQKLHYFYGRFIQAVARGRNMKVEEVDEVGRGRVWTGAQAKPLRLIDRFGGVGDAIAAAKISAGMAADETAEILLLPQKETSLVERVVSGVIGRAEPSAEESAAGALLSILPGSARNLLQLVPVSLWEQPGTPQARLPFVMIWE